MTHEPPADVDLASDSDGAHFWPAGTALAGMKPANQARMLELGTPRRYRPGDVLLTESENSTHVLLLTRGTVRCTIRKMDGEDRLVDIRGAGDTIGELAARDDEPRSATVTAAVQVEARLISQAEFIALDSDPDIRAALSASESHRSRHHTRLRAYGAEAPLVRLAKVLVMLAATYGANGVDGSVTILTPLTQSDLADLTTTARNTVEKAMASLRADGIVDRGYRQTKILDHARLRDLAFPHQERIPYW